MPPHLRFSRQDQGGWTIVEGTERLGEVHPDRMTFVGFCDAESALVAAQVASRTLRQWQASRQRADTGQLAISLTADGCGFTFAMPHGLWHALRVQLAHRIHVATRSLRNYEPEPAA